MATDADELARLSRELEQAELYEIHLRNRIVASRDELAASQVSRAQKCERTSPGTHAGGLPPTSFELLDSTATGRMSRAQTVAPPQYV